MATQPGCAAQRAAGAAPGGLPRAPSRPRTAPHILCTAAGVNGGDGRVGRIAPLTRHPLANLLLVRLPRVGLVIPALADRDELAVAELRVLGLDRMVALVQLHPRHGWLISRMPGHSAAAIMSSQRCSMQRACSGPGRRGQTFRAAGLVFASSSRVRQHRQHRQQPHRRHHRSAGDSSSEPQRRLRWQPRRACPGPTSRRAGGSLGYPTRFRHDRGQALPHGTGLGIAL